MKEWGIDSPAGGQRLFCNSLTNMHCILLFCSSKKNGLVSKVASVLDPTDLDPSPDFFGLSRQLPFQEALCQAAPLGSEDMPL